MTALERAKRSGDKKFILMDATFKKLKTGEIDKGQALEILGNSYENTIVMWLDGR